MAVVMKRVDLIQTGGFQAGDHLVTTSFESLPVPKENKEVLIQVKASAVNPVDWKQAERNFMLPPDLPASLGCDVAGVVVGPVESPLLGTRVVTYLGADKSMTTVNRPAFATHVCVEADLAFELPDRLTFAQACSLPVGGLTATLLLNCLRSKETTMNNDNNNEFLIVWGASSSVGFCAVQLALRQRGYDVIAIASQKQAPALIDLGVKAGHVVDYRNGMDDVVATVTEIIQQSSNSNSGVPKPLNGAVDCIGIADSFSTCARLVALFGTSLSTDQTVSSVTPLAFLPPPPNGVSAEFVTIGSLVNPDQQQGRTLVRETVPRVLQHVQPQPLRIVNGPVCAETVQQALQISKHGVSNENVVIEWQEDQEEQEEETASS